MDMTIDAGARLWLLKTAQKNYWRVARIYELDDLIQDGFMCYAMVVKRYTSATQREHLMALFKTTYTNHIHDLAVKQSKRLELPQAAFDEELDLDNIFGADGDAELSLILKQAPEPVRKVLELYTTADGLRALRAALREHELGRESLNMRLCRLAGLDPNTKILSMLRSYLGAQSGML